MEQERLLEVFFEEDALPNQERQNEVDFWESEQVRDDDFTGADMRPAPDVFKEIVRKFVTRLGDVREWTFDGEVIDLGIPSGKCTCDHPIRYVFVIHHPDGRTAPVGSECINHFQAYNPELWEKMKHAHADFWEQRKAAEKAAKEAQAQKDVMAARIPWLAVRKGAEQLLAGRKGWLSGDLYSLRVILNTKLPEYKRTKTYVTFYQRETKQIGQLIYRHLNNEATVDLSSLKQRSNSAHAPEEPIT
jgi:hypothetical protein